MSEPELELASESGLVYRYREAQNKRTPAVILLHGLGGDDNSMWVLEHVLPRGGLVVAPRGLFMVGERSYNWVDGPLRGWPTEEDFQPAVNALEKLVHELEDRFGLSCEELILMGFSQGAALAFATAAVPKLRPLAVIAAAGFLPEGNYRHLSGLSVFWGHGVKDEWVSIEIARSGAKVLQNAGAEVQLCETNVGHKLGLECLDGLTGWIERVWESR